MHVLRPYETSNSRKAAAVISAIAHSQSKNFNCKVLILLILLFLLINNQWWLFITEEHHLTQSTKGNGLTKDATYR